MNALQFAVYANVVDCELVFYLNKMLLMAGAAGI